MTDPTASDPKASEADFDIALVTAAFRLAAEDGWRKVTPAAAARAAGLSIAEARARFPGRNSILLRFGRLADQAALQDAPDIGPVRDRLFDLLMRRFDMLQANRAGVRALLRTLPTDPALAMLLASADLRSMRWMLQGAGIDATGPQGELQVRGLLAVWLWAVRAWDRDQSEDLSGTMATIDTALHRAEQIASWLPGRRAAPPPAPSNNGAGELDPSHPPPAEDLGTPDSPPPVINWADAADTPSAADLTLTEHPPASASPSLPESPPLPLAPPPAKS